MLGFLQFHAPGGKAKGARGDSCTSSDHRGDTVADNKRTKSDPSTKTANRQVPRSLASEDNEVSIDIVMKHRSMILRHVLRTQRVSIDCGFEVFSDPDIHLRNVNTINMMTKGFSKRDTVMRLQPFVVKPPLVLPASFSAMSGTANFLPEAQ